MAKIKTKQKKAVRVLEGFIIILLMQSLGTFLTDYFDLILPGNLTGLVLLFISLMLKIVKLEAVEEAASLLLDNMMALFIPLNVGLITILPRLKQEWQAILASLLLSTIIVMTVTAKIVEITEGRRGNAKLPS